MPLQNQQGKSLDGIQRWMQEAILDPRRAIEVEQIIQPSSKLGAEERLAVYQYAYQARLLECMATMFPATAMAFGDDSFRVLAAAFLSSHPSRSRNISHIGREFATFLAQTGESMLEVESIEQRDFIEFVVELAQLETVYQSVFDAAGPESATPLDPKPLLALPVEQVEQLRFEFHDTARLLTFEFPVHEFASAVRQRRDTSIPDRLPTWLLVSRQNYVVRRLPVSEPEARFLGLLMGGHQLGSVIAQLAENEAIGPDTLQRWFERWSSLSVFRLASNHC